VTLYFAGGIGSATAIYLGSKGCNLALADVDGDKAKDLIEELAEVLS